MTSLLLGEVCADECFFSEQKEGNIDFLVYAKYQKSCSGERQKRGCSACSGGGEAAEGLGLGGRASPSLPSSLSLSLCLCLSLRRSLSLPLSVSVTLCLSVPPSLSLSDSVSFSLCVSLSPCLSVSLSLFSLSVCLFVGARVFVSLFLRLGLSLSASVSFSLCVSVSMSLCISVSVLSLYVSLWLRVFVSLLSLCLGLSVSLFLCLCLCLSLLEVACWPWSLTVQSWKGQARAVMTHGLSCAGPRARRWLSPEYWGCWSAGRAPASVTTDCGAQMCSFQADT